MPTSQMRGRVSERSSGAKRLKRRLSFRRRPPNSTRLHAAQFLSSAPPPKRLTKEERAAARAAMTQCRKRKPLASVRLVRLLERRS